MRLSAVSNNCYFANIRIDNDLNMSMLIDTGSAVTLLSKDYFDELNHKQTILSDVQATLTTADGEPLKVYGKTNLSFALGGKTFSNTIIVAELGGMPGILGLDFMSKHNFIIDTGKGRLCSPDVVVELTREANLGLRCARVHLVETVHIPAYTEVYATGELRGHFGGENGCLEPLDKFRGGDHVVLPKAVADTTKENITISLMNPTPNPKIVKKNVQVAVVHPVEQILPYEIKTKTSEKNKRDIFGLKNRISSITTERKQELPSHLQPLVENTSKKLTRDQRNSLTDVIQDFSDIFVGPDGKLGQTSIFEHSIDTGDSKSIKLPPRRLPIHMRETAEKEITKMLEQDVIEKSNSPWAAPIVLVKKKDGSTRFCVDYRRLNLVTRKDAYPLPRIDESLDSLAGARFFCVMDLASGYWQMRVTERDRPKTAFATNKGLFQFKSMPFGLANSPASFERLMEIALSGLQWERCLVYLDDVIVFGKSFQETLDNLTTVFERFRSVNLKLKPKKCSLFADEVSYLGHIVSSEGVKCDPGKIETVKNWPTPANISAVRSFLGLASYYRKFIADFSTTSFPLVQLTRKDQRFVWSQDCDTAFHALKDALLSAPVLAYPTRDEPFILDTDASAYGIGAVLSQVQDGEEKVIAYGSKTLSRSQMRYCTTYRELLAVVVFVKQFKHFLYGRQFLIRTDHSSLTWLKNFKEPEGMVVRWISALETYDFEIKHRKGALHGNADGLSRRPRRRCKRDDCPQCCSETPSGDCTVSALSARNNNNVNTLVDTHPPHKQTKQDEHPDSVNTLVGENHTLTHRDSNWTSQWSEHQLKQLQHNDATITEAMELLKTHGNNKPRVGTQNHELGTLIRQWESLVVKDDILYRRFEDSENGPYLQVIVPKELRTDIFKQLHDCKTAAHFGRDKTLAKVRTRFYWPGMTSDVNRWCQTCMLCQKRKPGPGVGKAEMHHNTIFGPMECIAIDLMGPLPTTSRGNRYIMVVSDYFTKWTEAYPLEEHCAQTVADTLVIEFISRFGTPHRIHTDQGREFESQLFSSLCELLEISKSRTTPYRPQSDGMVERYNRTLQQTLSMFVNDNKDDWDEHLPYVTMAYRSSIQDSTKCTPNLLMLGREVSLPIDVMSGSHHDKNKHECPSQYVEWLRESMQRSFDIAHETLNTSFQKQKKYYDLKLKPRKFEIGSQVLRWYPPTANQKLGLGWRGPYKIKRQISDITYEIEDIATSKLIVVHVDHLKPLKTRDEQNSENTDQQNVSIGDESPETLSDEEDHVVVLNENSDTQRREDLALTPTFSRRGRQIKPPTKYSP